MELRCTIFVLAGNQSGYIPVASSCLPSVDSCSTISSVSKPLCLHCPGAQSKSMSCGVSAGLFLSARYVVRIRPGQAQLGWEHRIHSSHFSETLSLALHICLGLPFPSLCLESWGCGYLAVPGTELNPGLGLGRTEKD